jgi:hypothetical protein
LGFLDLPHPEPLINVAARFRDVYVEKYKGIGVCSGPQLGSTLRLFTKIWGISPTQFGYRMGMNGMDNQYIPILIMGVSENGGLYPQ